MSTEPTERDWRQYALIVPTVETTPTDRELAIDKWVQDVFPPPGDVASAVAAYRADLQREHAAEVEKWQRQLTYSCAEYNTQLTQARDEVERLKREKAEAVSALVNTDRHLDTARKELAEARSMAAYLEAELVSLGVGLP